MKQTYLLIVSGVGGAQLARIVCQSQAQAKREMEKYKDYHVTGSLCTARYSTEHGMFIPVYIIKTLHSK